MDLDAPCEKTKCYKHELLSGFDNEMNKARQIMFGAKLDLSILERQLDRFGPNGADIESLFEDLDEDDAPGSESDYSDGDESSTNVKIERMDVAEAEEPDRKRKVAEPCENRDPNSNFTKRTKSNVIIID